MATATFSVGDKVKVVTGQGYVNEGATGVVEALDGAHWVKVKWDEPKDGRIDGLYVAASFEAAAPTTVDYTVAIAALIDKTHTEAFARGKAEGVAEGKTVSDEEREEIRKLFVGLTEQSNKVYHRLRELKVV